MAKPARCRHRRHVKVHDWHHQSMGEHAEARWCPDCGALRRNWEKRWKTPGKESGDAD
jgi:hypothetical protein